MTCEEALTLISAKLDGTLSPAEEDALQAHLERCPDCRQVLQELTDAENGILELQADPPDTLVPGVMKKIRRAREKKAERKGFFWSAGVLASAAAVLAVLFGLGLIQLPGFDRSAPATAAIGHFYENAVEDEHESAARIADERDCAVLVVQTRGGTIAELDGLDCQTLADGAKLYTTDNTKLQSIQAAHKGDWAMAVYEPAGPYSTDASAEACVLLVP
jgi:anti-sigma factor RsiW